MAARRKQNLVIGSRFVNIRAIATIEGRRMPFYTGYYAVPQHRTPPSTTSPAPELGSSETLKPIWMVGFVIVVVFVLLGLGQWAMAIVICRMKWTERRKSALDVSPEIA